MAGRNTQGVKLVNLDAEDFVMDVARVVPDDESDSNGSPDGGDASNEDEGEEE